MTSSPSRRVTSSSSWARRLRTRTGWRACWRPTPPGGDSSRSRLCRCLTRRPAHSWVKWVQTQSEVGSHVSSQWVQTCSAVKSRAMDRKNQLSFNAETNWKCVCLPFPLSRNVFSNVCLSTSYISWREEEELCHYKGSYREIISNTRRRSSEEISLSQKNQMLSSLLPKVLLFFFHSWCENKCIRDLLSVPFHCFTPIEHCYHFASTSRDILLPSLLHIFDLVEGLPGLFELLVHGEEVLDARVHLGVLPNEEDDVLNLDLVHRGQIISEDTDHFESIARWEWLGEK